jgi:AraC-like DNA-binding protein
VAVQFAPALSPFCRLALTREDDEAVLALLEAPGTRSPVLARESLAACLVGQIRFVLGRSLPLREVRFDYAEPQDASAHRAFFGCPVRFGRARTELRFAASELQARVRFASDGDAPPLPARRVPASADGSLVERVEVALRERLDDPPDAEGTARLMGMSKRSLARALQHRGTTFQRTLDGVRKERALHCLSTTGLPIEEIAQQLGFSSGRAFRRAFRKWTGRAPSELRA